MHLLMTREELENKMAVLLGGRAAANATPSHKIGSLLGCFRPFQAHGDARVGAF